MVTHLFNKEDYVAPYSSIISVRTENVMNTGSPFNTDSADGADEEDWEQF